MQLDEQESIQGTQFTSWAFTRRAFDSGLMPSMGAVGSCYDNALIQSFWSRMQVELLDRRTWRTRVELANAILGTSRSSTTGTIRGSFFVIKGEY